MSTVPCPGGACPVCDITKPPEEPMPFDPDALPEPAELLAALMKHPSTLWAAMKTLDKYAALNHPGLRVAGPWSALPPIARKSMIGNRTLAAVDTSHWKVTVPGVKVNNRHMDIETAKAACDELLRENGYTLLDELPHTLIAGPWKLDGDRYRRKPPFGPAIVAEVQHNKAAGHWTANWSAEGVKKAPKAILSEQGIPDPKAAMAFADDQLRQLGWDLIPTDLETLLGETIGG